MKIISGTIRTIFRILQYIPDGCQLLTMPYRGRGILKSIACNHHNHHVRKYAFQLLGCRIGENVHFNPGICIVNDYPDEVLLKIGKNVALAPGIIFVCNSGPCNSELRENNEYVKSCLIKAKEISIGDDAWIGAGVIILPGVTIGNGAVVGAGSVVLDDISEYTIAAGVPAKEIRSIKEYNQF